MPGSSLWLVPPEDSELYKAIHELTINNIPSIFPNETLPGFFPHITLTSNALTNPALEPSNKQEWLDAILIPDSIKALNVAIQEVEVGKVFFKKLTMRCDKSHALCELAAVCRAAGVDGVDAEGAEKWVAEQYSPHCSLMYSELPVMNVNGHLNKVLEAVWQAKQRQPNSKTAKGGSIWLVPTFNPIEKWEPIAIRQLPDMEWTWQT